MTDHPLRQSLVDELHARPFPVLQAPCEAVYLAFKGPGDTQGTDRLADHAHLTALLGAAPAPGATHHAAPLGDWSIAWESHTEFVTFAAFQPGLSDRPFRGEGPFGPGWVSAAPGKRLAALRIRVERLGALEDMLAKLTSWMNPESLAVAQVLDGAAIIAGDFRLDAEGQMRFAVFVAPGTGPARVGRIVRRLAEIEIYRAMSMLALPRARALGGTLSALEPRLAALVTAMASGEHHAETTLHDLLTLNAELESLATQTAFRFGATHAYEALVTQRIAALREERIAGRQTFGEFMMRRYDPAMRTILATETRLATLTTRAARAGDLLRTRVDVERSAENQALLASMDRRADLALRLQHTVEGLSVVAISYYAVSLAAYMLAPLAERVGLSKGLLTALATPLVIIGVWLAIRRMKKALH